MSSEILEKTTFFERFERFCCLRLLAVKQLRKNQLPGGKHHASEGRASSKTTPKNSLTCRLKSWKKKLFREIREILLPAAASSKTASKKSAPGGKHHASEGRASPKTTPKNSTCRLKSWKNNIFREILLPAAASSQTASKKSAPGGKHHASEGRASSKTTPKNSLTCRLKSKKKQHFSRDFSRDSVACGC